MSEHLIQAAALILVWREPETQVARVLLAKRASNQRTFPDHWTFPGGVLEPIDGELSPSEQDLPEAALRRCALRETFEEVGLFGPDTAPPLAELHDLGWRVTPHISPRRFETRYFLLELTAEPGSLTLSAEFSAADWILPSIAVKAWEQGEMQIPPPVLTVLRVLADSPEATDLQLLRTQANDRDLPPLPIEVHPGIELVPVRTPTLAPATHTNSYLVGEQQFVIIDPATPYPAEQVLLRRAIERRLNLGHTPIAVLLTHHHRDHTGAAVMLSEWLNIPIAAHPETAALLPFEVQDLVVDGQTWDLAPNWQVQAMFTPGHAPGHLIFIESRSRAAIVGDMLAGLGTILIKRPRGHMGHYLDSLKRMTEASLSKGFSAHGPRIVNLTARCQEYIQHRLQREYSVLNALQAGPLSESELLKAVYADLDPRVLPIARWSLDAHLEHLVEQGKVLEEAGSWMISA